MLRRISKVFGGGGEGDGSGELKRAQLKKRMAELEVEIAELDEETQQEDVPLMIEEEESHGRSMWDDGDGRDGEYVPSEEERRAQEERGHTATHDPAYEALMSATRHEGLEARYSPSVYIFALLFACGVVLFLFWGKNRREQAEYYHDHPWAKREDATGHEKAPWTHIDVPTRRY